MPLFWLLSSDVWVGAMGGLSHEDYYPRLCDRSRRCRDDRLWALGSLHSDQRKGRSPPGGLRTNDPNSSSRFWPDWRCAGLAAVGPGFLLGSACLFPCLESRDELNSGGGL